jgi:hypothetical protein
LGRFVEKPRHLLDGGHLLRSLERDRQLTGHVGIGELGGQARGAAGLRCRRLVRPENRGPDHAGRSDRSRGEVPPLEHGLELIEEAGIQRPGHAPVVVPAVGEDEEVLHAVRRQLPEERVDRRGLDGLAVFIELDLPVGESAHLFWHDDAPFP